MHKYIYPMCKCTPLTPSNFHQLKLSLFSFAIPCVHGCSKDNDRMWRKLTSEIQKATYHSWKVKVQSQHNLEKRRETFSFSKNETVLPELPQLLRQFSLSQYIKQENIFFRIFTSLHTATQQVFFLNMKIALFLLSKQFFSFIRCVVFFFCMHEHDLM